MHLNTRHPNKNSSVFKVNVGLFQMNWKPSPYLAHAAVVGSHDDMLVIYVANNHQLSHKAAFKVVTVKA